MEKSVSMVRSHLSRPNMLTGGSSVVEQDNAKQSNVFYLLSIANSLLFNQTERYGFESHLS